MATSRDHLDKGSAEPFQECTPCDTDGKQAAAVGYCVNCREFLCQRCFDGHLIPSLTRKHTLLDKEHMPDATTSGEDEEFSKACPRHEEDVITYYCPTHSFYGCNRCFYTHQKSCKDVKYIPEICENGDCTDEYKDFMDGLIRIAKKCSDNVTVLNPMLQSIEQSHTKALEEFREFKMQLLDAVDTAEKDLVDKANKKKKEDLKATKELIDKCMSVLKENETITFMVESKQGDQVDLYIAMVKSKDKLKTMENEIDAIAKAKGNHSLTFKPNNDIANRFNSPWPLGRLEEPGNIETAVHSLDVNIKTETDKVTCQIVGSALLSENQIVLSDRTNKSLKLVDITDTFKVISEVKLSSAPLGVCKISDKEIAVAEENNIVFVKTEPSLCIHRDFPITRTSHGLAYCDEKLVVSYDSPAKLEVMDMQGTVLNTFVNDDQGHALFNAPYHLTINPENKHIYVSNHGSHSVVCLKFDGAVVAKYTDSELSRPRQVITSSNGMVYVCGHRSYNLHQLTEDCKKVNVILTGLYYPYSVVYDETRGKLFMGQYNSDALKVYDVSCKLACSDE